MNIATAETGFRLWLRVAFLVYALGVFAYRDSLMDDTFIHLQYARHLRTQGELAFNAGEPSMGATSPLWILILALLGATPAAARLASVGFGALGIWLFALQARRHCGPLLAAAATVAWAGNLWLIRHAPNGMESTAAACFVLLCMEIRARTAGKMRDVLLGLALAGAALLRPELALLAAVLAGVEVIQVGSRRRSLSSLALCLTAFLVPIAAWCLFAWLQTGAILPGTASAKSAGPGLLAAWAVWKREARIVGAAHPVEGVGLAVALVLQVRLEGWRGLRRWVSHPWLPYVAFALLLWATYATFDVQVQPRYLLPALPVVTLAGFAAWRAVLGSSRRGAILLALLALGASATVSAVRVLPVTRDYGRGLVPALEPLVEEMHAVRPGARSVATPDIGYLGYRSGLRVIDLGGLIDPRMRHLRRTLGSDSLLTSGAFLEAGRVDFVVDRDAMPRRFAGMHTQGLKWTALRTTRIPNLGLSRPTPVYYTLYRLDP